MVLIDTSVWITHLRSGHSDLVDLLNDGRVASHPFIIGELACGGLKNRKEILSLLQALPLASVADHNEVLQFIDNHKLMNRGIGYIDVHILASALVTGIPIWTFDKKLGEISTEFDLGFKHEQ